MFIVFEDRMLNMDHVSRVLINSDGSGGYKVVAEYDLPIFRPSSPDAYGIRDDWERFEFTLTCGSEEYCKDFIRRLGFRLKSDQGSLLIEQI